jgi:hypothetical protein
VKSNIIERKIVLLDVYVQICAFFCNAVDSWSHSSVLALLAAIKDHMSDLNSATARNKVWCTVAAELAALELTVRNACAGITIMLRIHLLLISSFCMGRVVLECFLVFECCDL